MKSNLNRRELLIASGATLALAALPRPTFSQPEGHTIMATIKTSDGTNIFY
ncbi:MAG: hypothetical protein RIA08_01215 [Roseovarius sp.]